MSRRLRVSLVHAPAVKLLRNGANIGAVRTHYPKISQLILAGIIERDVPECDVRVIDMKIASSEEVKYKEVRYGRDLIEVYRIGMPIDELEADVVWSDVLIFTSNFTQEAEVIGDVMEFAKAVKPSVEIWVGGSDAMVVRGEVDRQAYFRSRGADYVAAGDGELILPDLLRRRAAESTTLMQFDRVPDPALHHARLDQYWESHEGGLPNGVEPPLMYLETSRGCRQSCDFCSTPFTKGRFRYMSQERIESMLGYLSDHGIRTLLLIEDNILSRLDLEGGRQAVLDWFHYMRREGFCWEFANGVELGKLELDGWMDEELIDAMFGFDGEVGCYRSYLPLERIDTVNLPYLKLKPFDIQKELILAIVDRGVPLLNMGVIIGNPEETKGSLERTEERLTELRSQIVTRSENRTLPFANIFLHIPICGTNDYRRFADEDRLLYPIDTNPELYNFYTSILRGEHLTFSQLTDLRREMAVRLNGEELLSVWEDGGSYYPSGFNPFPGRARPQQVVLGQWSFTLG